jgi:hypothetical protein
MGGNRPITRPLAHVRHPLLGRGVHPKLPSVKLEPVRTTDNAHAARGKKSAP